MRASVAIRTGFKKMFVFEGRAGKAEFWWFYSLAQIVGFAFVSMAVVVTFSSFLAATPDGELLPDTPRLAAWFGSTIALQLAVLVVLTVAGLMTLGAQVRRLHDTGRSAHWLWFHVVGLGGVLLYVWFLPSEAGANRWG